jgi:hypothetical protein
MGRSALMAQSSSSAGKSEGAKAKRTSHMAMAKTTVWTKDEGEWMDVPVFPAGAKMKVASGDPKTGPSDLYVKMPAGYGVPFHWHTPVESVYLTSGTMELEMIKTKEKKSIEAGSLFIAPGKMIHKASCTSKDDCLFFLHSSGPFDIHLVGQSGKEPKTTAKRSQ